MTVCTQFTIFTSFKQTLGLFKTDIEESATVKQKHQLEMMYEAKYLLNLYIIK